MYKYNLVPWNMYKNVISEAPLCLLMENKC